ncbi:hypothetical protein I4F81_010423 [Pyropia yezoensis]|uniref:Uncharacterized protein n=1 Tax=Pyropia yezoensis TaxID=2788 RepID=A0ACC3CD66_PYRYE|nr:hypothetical protein I4F81_010423 [Neopyropia yezoensis]
MPCLHRTPSLLAKPGLCDHPFPVPMRPPRTSPPRRQRHAPLLTTVAAAAAVIAAVASAASPAFAVAAFPPTTLWHVDRVNQASLPLDGNTLLPPLVPPPAASKYGSSTPSPAPNARPLPTVYVLSVGVDASHEVFATTALTIYDATGGAGMGNGGGGDDCIPHGTLAAGLVAGTAVGLAPGMPLAVVAVAKCEGARPAAVVCANMDEGLAWVAAEAGRRAAVAKSAGGGGGGVVVLPPDVPHACFASLAVRLRELWEGGGGTPGMALFAPAPTTACTPAASTRTAAAGVVVRAVVAATTAPRVPPILVVAPTNAVDESPLPPPGCSPPHLRAPGANITSAYRGATGTTATSAAYAVAVALPGMAPAGAAALAARVVAARPGLSPKAIGTVLAAASAPVVRVTPPPLLASDTRRYRAGVPLDSSAAAAALAAVSADGTVAAGDGLLTVELRVGIDEAPAWRWLGDVAAAAVVEAVPGGTLLAGARGGWAVGHPGGVQSQPAAVDIRVLVAVSWEDESSDGAGDGADGGGQEDADGVAALRLAAAGLEGLAAIVASAVNATPEVSALGATLLGVRVRKVYPVDSDASPVSAVGEELDHHTGDDTYGETANAAAVAGGTPANGDNVVGARQGVVSGRVVLAVAGGAAVQQAPETAKQVFENTASAGNQAVEAAKGKAETVPGAVGADGARGGGLNMPQAPAATAKSAEGVKAYGGGN